MMVELKCENCGSTFWSHRTWARCCSEKCRRELRKKHKSQIRKDIDTHE